jgi:4-hydroxythreonine-4-phosphate dehydrogenase
LSGAHSHGAPQPLCVTIGEPAGIGPDIILTAWAGRKRLNLPPFYVIGDPAMLARRALAISLPIKISAIEAGDTPGPFGNGLPVAGLSGAMTGEPGKPSPADAPLVIEAIRAGVDAVFAGKASGLVTCPISKEALYGAGFTHPGHTEFLAELAREKTGKSVLPVMMIASDAVRTVPVTIHIALAQVPQALTMQLIIDTARVTAHGLKQRFGIEKPRLAVAGLNPHAGEGGAMGREDIEIIAPAIAQLRAEGIVASGPLPADTMFHAKARAGYDAALCMYHDQALIPAKTLAFEDGVNVTLGLPFIRTSPDHGTAFGIAGSGKADPSSFVAALRMAHDMALRAQKR